MFELLGSDSNNAWRQLSVEERIDAVIIHETIENRIVMQNARSVKHNLYGDDWQSSHLQTLIEQVQRSRELPVSDNVRNFLHKQLQDTYPDVNISSSISRMPEGYIRMTWHAHPAQKLFLFTLKTRSCCDVLWSSSGLCVPDSVINEGKR